MDFSQRKGMHLYQLNNNKHHSRYLQNAWDKYGKDNFIFEIIEYVDDPNLLLEREQFYLNKILFANKKDNRFKELGYNIQITAGSWFGKHHSEKTKKLLSLKQKGFKHTEETKKKMRESSPHISGKAHPCYGKRPSENAINGIKEYFKKEYKKENHPFYNKKIEGEHLEKLKKASAGSNNSMYHISVIDVWFEKYGEEIAKKKWGKSNRMRSINGLGKGTKSVIQKDKNNYIIREFESMTEASIQTNTNINCIGYACKGKRKSAGGFMWEYKNKG